jgi:hypothetical protein
LVDKLRYVLIAIIVCLGLESVAWANGETLYYRSATACTFNGDGTAYTCAASAGAAGAYLEPSTNILTAATNTVAKVDPGDTLYVCGAHTTMLTVPTRSGTLGLEIIVDGRCPGDPGSITVGSTAIAALAQTAASDYWIFRYLTLSGGTTAVLYCNGVCDHDLYEYNTLTCTHVAVGATMGIRMRNFRNSTLAHNTVTGAKGSPTWACSTGILIDYTSANAAFCCNILEYNTVSGFPGPGIRIAGKDNSTFHPGPETIRYNTAFDNGDGFYPVNADNITNTGNVSYGNLKRDQGGEGYGYAALWCENIIYEDNIAYGNNGRGIEIFSGEDTGFGTRNHLHGTIRRNYLYNNNQGAFAINSAILINNGPAHIADAWDLVEVYGNVTVGSSSSFMVDDGITAVVYNNTFVSPTTEACIYLLPNADNVTFKNNLCVPGTASGIYGIWDENGTGVANVYSNNLIDPTHTTIFAKKNATTYDITTITTLDPNIVIGDPLLAANYHTLPGSPARFAGATVSPCQDLSGAACDVPPTIGAFQVMSGVTRDRSALSRARSALSRARTIR